MAPNLLDYILQAKGWLCLAVEFGLLNREVVGWSLKPRMKADIVIEALTMASFRRPAPARGGARGAGEAPGAVRLRDPGWDLVSNGRWRSAVNHREPSSWVLSSFWLSGDWRPLGSFGAHRTRYATTLGTSVFMCND